LKFNSFWNVDFSGFGQKSPIPVDQNQTEWRDTREIDNNYEKEKTAIKWKDKKKKRSKCLQTLPADICRAKKNKRSVIVCFISTFFFLFGLAGGGLVLCNIRRETDGPGPPGLILGIFTCQEINRSFNV
jgi:hypothetical protein